MSNYTVNICIYLKNAYTSIQGNHVLKVFVFLKLMTESECHCNLVEVLGCIGMNQNWPVNFPPSYIPFGEPTLPSTSSRTKSQHWVQCSSPTAFRKRPLHTRSSLYLFMSVFYTTHICSLNPASLGKLAYSTNFHKVAGSHKGLLFCT